MFLNVERPRYSTWAQRQGLFLVSAKKRPADRSRSERSAGRWEDRHGFVACELDDVEAPSLNNLGDYVRVARREFAGGLVAALLGETGVSADVGDKEGLN
jgi:hypothetical protein